MSKTLRQSIGDLSSENMREVLRTFQSGIIDTCLNAAGLAIKVGGSKLVKSVNTVNCFISGAFITKAASDMAALSGTIVDGNSNVFVFTVNAAGTLATYIGTAGATNAAVVFPVIPTGEVVLGFVMIHTVGADFVGGTTALDAGTVTAIYVDTGFPFNPNVDHL